MTEASALERREIAVRGIVQGVGFRPFIYTLARRHGLVGWVRNDAEGVQIEVEGSPAELDCFLQNLKSEAPPLAVVETVSWQSCAVGEEREFRIEESREAKRRHALISPDAAVCADCLEELFDPADRRYRYPFLNCTNCGPRFTITSSLPYDRARTTMAGFPMCSACGREYEDPADRRFHAQPNACPDCGPQARLLDASGRERPGEDAIHQAAGLLREGAIVAVKGLGGYHLACSPFDRTAAKLRERKARQDKPFALMAFDLEQARTLCRIGPEEAVLLTSSARPIVLLERREDAGIAAEVAPRQKTLGIMAAYTPLHYLLLHDTQIPLVMTSGNRSDEPIAYRDEEALVQLAGIADYFLTHDRPIHIRCDDSIVRMAGVPVFRSSGAGESETASKGEERITRLPALCILRRSRGFAPAPLRTATCFVRPILACGGELKNTFCIGKENHIFLSHHIGDLENYETFRSFREGIEHYCRLFDVQPEVMAYDLHPDYLSTRYALEWQEEGIPAVGIQHHHAHIAACLADNERPDDERVIGVALDGTGYGTDGTIWGGEYFVGSIAEGFVRRAHLQSIPLPGGAAAIRQPWHMALAQLIRLYGEEDVLRLPLPLVQQAGARRVRLIARLLEHGLNTPLTSSAGRLFDVVAALVCVPGSRQITYEGQAAIELEMAASGGYGQGYPFQLRPDGPNWIVETDNMLAAVVEDLLSERSVGEIAARFHRTMADVVVAGCLQIREALPPTVDERCAVALSGGTFQNVLLLERVQELLARKEFPVYQHRRVPTNDGGLCLGQAVLANRHFRNGNG